jgi:hypothetical protein
LAAGEVAGGEPRAVGPPAGLSGARDALAAAEAALRQGDWAAFGQAMQRLRDVLGRLGEHGDGS